MIQPGSTDESFAKSPMSEEAESERETKRRKATAKWHGTVGASRQAHTHTQSHTLTLASTTANEVNESIYIYTVS